MPNREFLTFDQIVSRMQSLVGTRTKRIDDFGEDSYNQAVIEACAWFAEWLQNQLTISELNRSNKYAKGAALDRKLGEYFLDRKLATAAYTTITFSRDTPASDDFTIDEGSQVFTETDEFGGLVTYAVDNDVTFASGGTSVTGLVTCTETGSIGNVPSGTIVVANIVGIDSVTNKDAVTTGQDKETDTAYLQRLPDYLVGLRRGNKSSVLSAAHSVPGITFASIRENYPAAGHFQLYVTTSTGDVSNETKTLVSGAVEAVRATCVTYDVLTPEVININVIVNMKTGRKYTLESTQAAVQALLKLFVNEQNANGTVLYSNYLAHHIFSNILDMYNVDSIYIAQKPTTPTTNDFSVNEGQVIRVSALGDITVNITQV